MRRFIDRDHRLLSKISGFKYWLWWLFLLRTHWKQAFTNNSQCVFHMVHSCLREPRLWIRYKNAGTSHSANGHRNLCFGTCCIRYLAPLIACPESWLDTLSVKTILTLFNCANLLTESTWTLCSLYVKLNDNYVLIWVPHPKKILRRILVKKFYVGGDYRKQAWGSEGSETQSEKLAVEHVTSRES